MENKNKQSFSTILKNIFFLVLILQFIPIILKNIKNNFQKIVAPQTHVGKLTIKNIITDATFYVKHIKKFAKNDDIAAVFLKIDCPGGTPGASQSVFEEIKRLKVKKPVIVLTENVCASGGYYMASAANKIISPASALVGSIGVYLQVPNIKKLLDQWNIKFDFIQSGEYKTAGNPLKEQTDKEMNYLQNLSDQSYKEFVKDVANARKLDISKEKFWANGQVFVATDAKKLGLIDEIGSQSKAEEVLRELANIENKIKFITPKKSFNIMQLFAPQNEDDLEQTFTSKISTLISDIIQKTYFNLAQKNEII